MSGFDGSTCSVANTGPSCLRTWRGLLLEIRKLREVMHVGVAGRARHGGEVHLGVRDRMSAVGLVGAVLHHDVHEVVRRGRGGGDEAAEIHQQAAVALQADDAFAGPSERQPQGVGGVEPHRTDGEVIERALPEVEPVHRRAVGRHDDLVGHVARKHPEAFVALHHDAEGLRPISSATGCDLA